MDVAAAESGRGREDSAKRRQILDGARAVFLADGFDAASMNEIARAAGVSKGTLYVYFDSKDELFAALIREEKREQAEQICRFDNDDPDVEAVLRIFGGGCWSSCSGRHRSPICGPSRRWRRSSPRSARPFTKPARSAAGRA